MVKRCGPPSQGWRTFLRNHAPDIAAMDLFVVPTIGFDLLYVLVIIRLERRNLVWINVTPNPSAEWVARQITEAFPWTEAPRYLIRDRDRVYGVAVMHRLRAMGIRDKPIAPGSPWQNGFAERLIGSIRRECVDHILVLSETHLRRILKSYARYYNEMRTHRSLDRDAPLSRPVSGSAASCHMLSSVDCITTTSESEFLLPTGQNPWLRHDALAAELAGVSMCPLRRPSCGGQALPRRENGSGKDDRGELDTQTRLHCATNAPGLANAHLLRDSPDHGESFSSKRSALRRTTFYRENRTRL
jgi:hypothetical protein